MLSIETDKIIEKKLKYYKVITRNNIDDQYMVLKDAFSDGNIVSNCSPFFTSL